MTCHDISTIFKHQTRSISFYSAGKKYQNNCQYKNFQQKIWRPFNMISVANMKFNIKVHNWPGQQFVVMWSRSSDHTPPDTLLVFPGSGGARRWRPLLPLLPPRQIRGDEKLTLATAAPTAWEWRQSYSLLCLSEPQWASHLLWQPTTQLSALTTFHLWHPKLQVERTELPAHTILHFYGMFLKNTFNIEMSNILIKIRGK